MGHTSRYHGDFASLTGPACAHGPTGYRDRQRASLSHGATIQVADIASPITPAFEAPRLLNPDLMSFQIGQMAVYPAHGVVEVVGIDTKQIGGGQFAFYLLKVLENGMQIMVPKDKADQVGLRAVATANDIDEMFAVLRDSEVLIDKQTWNRRYRGFMEKIKTGSLFDVAEVFRDLMRLRASKNLSFGERRMLETAKTLMVKEVALARRWTDVKAGEELDRACA